MRVGGGRDAGTCAQERTRADKSGQERRKVFGHHVVRAAKAAHFRQYSCEIWAIVSLVVHGNAPKARFSQWS